MQAKAAPRDRAERNGEPFDLLSNHRRRWTVRICKHDAGPVELGELAERIAAKEQGKDVDEVMSAERKRVYTSLQQTHVPRLEEAGMIEVEDHRLRLTDRGAELDVYMDAMGDPSLPWALCYLTVAAVTIPALGLAWVGVLPGILASPGLIGTLGVFAFSASALVHTYLERGGPGLDITRPETTL